MTTLLERPMAKRTDVSVKIDEDVVRKARIVADFEDKSLAAYLSDVLRPIVDSDLARHSRQVLGMEPPQAEAARAKHSPKK